MLFQTVDGGETILSKDREVWKDKVERKRKVELKIIKNNVNDNFRWSAEKKTD